MNNSHNSIFIYIKKNILRLRKKMISMIFDFLYLAKMHSLQILFFNNLIGTNMNMKLETTNLQL